MNDKKPLFSIATPCWNSVNTIERTIKSILAQDFKDYEYIIVDGGSTDGTLEIIKKYEPLFEGRMFWRSEPDKGLYDAFNKGVERSRGIYCWNVNADDYIEPDVLSKLASFISSHKWETLPVISGAMNFVAQSGKILYKAQSDEKKLHECFKKDHIGVPHPATLVPKDVYEKYGAFDITYRIIGDADWFHRAYLAGVKFVFIDFVLTNMSDGGVSNTFNYKKSLKDRIYYIKKHYPHKTERVVRLIRWTLSFYKQMFEHWISNRKHEE